MPSPRYLKITVKELESLIETAESCKAMGGDLADEAAAAVKAYNAVLKRNGLAIDDAPQHHPQRIDNIR